MASSNIMDPIKAAPFQFGEGSRACLLLHGFTGSPWDLKPLGEALAQRNYHVQCITLPGHGSTPEAMMGVSYRDWEGAAETALLGLGGFERVFVAGLSMGSLLAVLLAARYPNRVHGLALLAPAMRFQGSLVNLARVFHLLPLIEHFHPYLDKTSSDIEDPVSRAEAPLLAAFPTARLGDVWTLQGKVRAAVPKVRAPALIVVAQNDHVVSERGARELAVGLRKVTTVEWITLKEGFHIIPRDVAAATLFAEVSKFFDRWSAGRVESTKEGYGSTTASVGD